MASTSTSNLESLVSGGTAGKAACRARKAWRSVLTRVRSRAAFSGQASLCREVPLECVSPCPLVIVPIVGTGFHVAQARLELPVLMTLNFRPSCCYASSAGTIEVYHYACLVLTSKDPIGAMSSYGANGPHWFEARLHDKMKEGLDWDQMTGRWQHLAQNPRVPCSFYYPINICSTPNLEPAYQGTLGVIGSVEPCPCLADP